MTSDLTQRDIAQHHRRAVRFFWWLLLAAATVSLVSNIAHAVLPYIPTVAIQISAAAVPPVFLLGIVHGMSLAVRAGASGTIYRCAVSAIAIIGLGAFSMSFIAQRDLMLAIGYNPGTAWIFPAITDVTAAVCTLVLVVLGDKPARRARASSAEIASGQRSVRSEKTQLRDSAPVQRVQAPSSRLSAPSVSKRAQTGSPQHVLVQADGANSDTELAAQLIESGITTQPLTTVVAVLEAHSGGATINAAASAMQINYRTAKRIVEAAAKHRQRALETV